MYRADYIDPNRGRLERFLKETKVGAACEEGVIGLICGQPNILMTVGTPRADLWTTPYQLTFIFSVEYSGANESQKPIRDRH